MASIDHLSNAKLRTVRKRPRFQMARTVSALMLREMATTYGNSAGGYFWAILEPVLGIALLSVIFSLAVSSPPMGSNFALFYASGFLPFVMFNSLSAKIARSVSFSRPFMGYPCVTFMDTMVARLLLNSLTEVLVICIVIFGIFTIYDLPVWIDVNSVATAIGVGIMVAAGIGTINCYLMTAFPIYERIWSILTRPLFLISGIFFTFDSMPKIAQDILWYNPIIHIVGLMRKGLYPTYNADYVSITYVTLIASVTAFFGLLLLVRHFKFLMEST